MIIRRQFSIQDLAEMQAIGTILGLKVNAAALAVAAFAILAAIAAAAVT
jgi:hypothetical protein